MFLLGAAAGTASYLSTVKRDQAASADAAKSLAPEPVEVIEAAAVQTRRHARTTTAIGTARALRSITLRNELPGTVRMVALTSGQLVEVGEVLVELDVAVEQAELEALEAEARLAAAMRQRMEQALASHGAAAADVDRARAEHDKALANVTRLRETIGKKRITAPFRARVSMVDLHVGQYLDAGTTLTTLQGVDDAVHVDFAVTQDTAATLAVGGEVEVIASGHDQAVRARIVAIDPRVDAATRNNRIRARLEGGDVLASPGAAVRVRVPTEPAREVLVVPANALRRGPAGDHVFVLNQVSDGQVRAAMRRVVAGAAVGDVVVVRDGLQVGERVATTGSFKLREGVLVQVVGAPASLEK